MKVHRTLSRMCYSQRGGWKCWLLRLVATFLILFLVCQGIVQLIDGVKSCVHGDSLKFLKSLCLAYKQGTVNGTLCHDVCSPQRMTFYKCLNFKAGKVVLVMDWTGSKVILKTKEIEIPFPKTLHFVLGYPEGAEITEKNPYPNWEEFRMMVIRELKQSIGYEGDNKRNRSILTEIWGINPEKYQVVNVRSERAKTTAMNSIWSLVQQPEYTFMRTNQNWQFIPEVFGTCGQFYAVEFMETNPTWNHIIFRSSQLPWLQRAGMAVQMLRFVTDMDSHFPEALHICDVKWANFGMSSSGQLKAIDLDMCFLDTQMVEVIVSTETCATHEDCSFFDCLGWCDVESKTCLKKRINNNLQKVCEKIFLSNLINGYSGLLGNPPSSVEAELGRVLEQCAQPADSPSPEVPGKAGPDIMKSLIRLLGATLHSS